MNLFELLVSVKIDTSGIKEKFDTLKQAGQKVEKSLNSNFSKIASGFKVMAAAFVATVILKTLNKIIEKTVELGKETVKLSSDAKEMNDKFDIVFKGMEKETRQWADNFSNDIGRSKTKIRGFLADNQDLLTGFGMGTEKGAEMSKSIIKLGVDLASFQNKADKDVLDNLQSGLLGNHMAVKSLGLAFTETELALTMYQMELKGTFDALTAAEKMEVRLATAYRQSKNALGDATRTAMNYANQNKRLQANMSELKTTIGDAFLPVLTVVIRKMNSFFDTLKKNSDAIKNRFTSGINFAIDTMIAFLKSISIVLRGISAFVKSNEKWINGFYNIFSKNFNLIKKIVIDTISFISDSWEKHGAEISKSVKTILEEIAEIYNKILLKITELWEKHKNKVKIVIDFVVEHISTGFKIVAEILKGVNDLLSGDTPAALEHFKNAFGIAVDQVSKDATTLKTAWENSGLFSFLDDLTKKVEENKAFKFLKSIVELPANLIMFDFSSTFENLKSVWQNGLKDVFYLPLDFFNFISEQISSSEIFKEIEKIVMLVPTGLEVLKDELFQLGKDIIQGFINGMKENWTTLKDNVTEIKNSVISKIEERTNSFFNFGKNIVDGTINGINSGINKVKEATGLIGKSAEEGIKEELEIHSPSKVFQELAKWIIEGLTSIFGKDKTVKEASSALAKDTKKGYEENTKDIGKDTTKNISKNIKKDNLKQAGQEKGKEFSDGVIEFVDSTADYIDDNLITGLENIKLGINTKEAEKKINDFTEETKTTFQKTSDFLSGIFKSLFSNIKDFFKGSFVGKAVSSIAGVFSNKKEDSQTSDSDTTTEKESSSVGTIIADFFSNILQKFSGDNALSSAISSMFSGDIAGTFLGIFEGFAGESEVFTQLMQTLNDTIGTVVAELMPMFNQLIFAMRPLIPIVSKIMLILGKFLIEVLQDLLPMIIPILDALIPVLQLFLGVIQPIIAVMSKVLNPALLVVAKVIASIANAFIGIYNAIASALRRIGIRVRKISKVKLDTDTSKVVSSSSTSTSNSSGYSSSGYSSNSGDLTKLLAPLANFNNLVSIVDNIYKLLLTKLTNTTITNDNTTNNNDNTSNISSFVSNLFETINNYANNYITKGLELIIPKAQSFNLVSAAAGEQKSYTNTENNYGNVIIESINITSYSNNQIDLTKDLVDTLETELASRQFWNRKRGV